MGGREPTLCWEISSTNLGTPTACRSQRRQDHRSRATAPWWVGCHVRVALWWFGPMVVLLPHGALTLRLFEPPDYPPLDKCHGSWIQNPGTCLDQNQGISISTIPFPEFQAQKALSVPVPRCFTISASPTPILFHSASQTPGLVVRLLELPPFSPGKSDSSNPLLGGAIQTDGPLSDSDGPMLGLFIGFSRRVDVFCFGAGR